ncbi:MAG: hypothetical protein GX802_06725, partial [Clostridiales bacterium]|nr:hypothetical protein [Clostridiales bacterium]
MVAIIALCTLSNKNGCRTALHPNSEEWSPLSPSALYPIRTVAAPHFTPTAR